MDVAVIEAYIQQYESKQVAPAEEGISALSVTETGVVPPPGTKEVEGTKGTGKRPMEDEIEPGSEGSTPSTQKRPKLEELAKVVVLE